jgi:hypothetical protein
MTIALPSFVGLCVAAVSSAAGKLIVRRGTARLSELQKTELKSSGVDRVGLAVTVVVFACAFAAHRYQWQSTAAATLLEAAWLYKRATNSYKGSWLPTARSLHLIGDAVDGAGWVAFVVLSALGVG